MHVLVMLIILFSLLEQAFLSLVSFPAFLTRFMCFLAVGMPMPFLLYAADWYLQNGKWTRQEERERVRTCDIIPSAASTQENCKKVACRTRRGMFMNVKVQSPASLFSKVNIDKLRLLAVLVFSWSCLSCCWHYHHISI